MRALLILLLCLAATLARAAEPVLLVSDSIRFDQSAGLLIARGHVQITQGPVTLTAAEIRYDTASGAVSATGPIMVSDGSGTRIFADAAELSADLRAGIISGARALMENRLQIAADEIEDDGRRYTVFRRTVASTCQVCFDRPVPIWQLRSSRIVHDRLDKTLLFHDARFEMFGLPLLALPVLKTPAPGVRRASGLLVPKFLTTNLYGTAVKLPWYVVFDDQSDLTLTPFLTTSGTSILEAEYRREFVSGPFRLAGALAPAIGGASGPRGYLSVALGVALPRGFALELDATMASDEAFLREYGYSRADLLTSTLSLGRVTAHESFALSAVVFQSLRDDSDFSTIPVVLPEFQLRRILPGRVLGGTLAFGADALGLVRGDGRDVLRAGISADWQRFWLFDNGLRLDALTGVRVSAIRVGDDAAFDGGTILASTATLGLDLTWPLMRGSRAATEMLTPRIQLLATDNHPGNDAVPNEDSQQIEFDETNLFALSRYPGVDQAETGLRANIGLSYLRSAASGWELGLTGGRVFRLGSESEFSDGSGLGSAVSDYVAAATLTWRDRVAMRARVLVDPDLAFKRAETSLGLRQESYALDASYLHLDADANAGAPDARNEVALGGRWQFRPSWELAASGRYDLTRDRPIEWAGGLTFGNECIRAELSVSRSFATSDNVPQATVFGLSVNLAGFGADPEGEWQASACGP